jgi:hypothetical protein
MKLPHLEKAMVPQAKVTDYLLSDTHLDGRHKEAFFTAYGFAKESWDTLAETLLQHAAEHEVAKAEDSPFGTRYVVEGIIRTPDGRTALLRSVWFIRHGEEEPRLATAYPLRERTTP